MKKVMALVSIAVFACALVAPVCAGSKEEGKSGEELFSEHCAVCHPDGGNIINDKKTLKKASLKANGIKTAGDIVRTMRNPGPGMKKFESSEINDKDGEKIAKYILKTFK